MFNGLHDVTICVIDLIHSILKLFLPGLTQLTVIPAFIQVADDMMLGNWLMKCRATVRSVVIVIEYVACLLDSML